MFTFNFTKEGREGTFLTLTAAPVYFTMALTGIVGGYLLENYYPAKEDETHKRKPEYIWLTIIGFSLISFLSLYLGQGYFNVKEEEPEVAKDNSSQESSLDEPLSLKHLRQSMNPKKGAADSENLS